MALASVPFCFRGELALVLGAVPGNAMKLADYYSHFGVDEAAIRGVMATALEKGGDFCDLYFQQKIFNYIGLEDNAVNRAYTGVDLGVGVRVVKGDQTGYSFTEEITPVAMALAAKTAANIADTTKTSPAVEMKLHQTPQYYSIQLPWDEVKTDRKVPLLQKINDKVFAKDRRFTKCRVAYIDEASSILIATSDGRLVYDYQPMATIYVSCNAEQKGQKEEGYFGLSGRRDISYFGPENLDRLANEAARRTLLMFEAVKPAAGEMEVVLAPGESGILLHEAIGHGMEADFNRKKMSIFSDKMGQPVAEKFVSIVDDGTLPNLRGSANIDDEGNDTERTILVENGILRSYLHDRISANYYRVKPTGNGRRESFRFMPIPRMRNTYMLPGPHNPEEIVGSVKKGLYVEQFTNGQVNIGAGDFTFYVKTGYLIEGGKLTRPVKDVNIIGNGPEVLRRITMVGNNLKFSEGGWTCGKDGQGMPNDMGLPTVKVSAITVGGVNA